MKLTSLWDLAVLGSISAQTFPVASAAPGWHLAQTVACECGNPRLRTKLLLSFVLLSAGLTCATLLVVRRSAQAQMQHQVEQDARNATLLFQVMEHQHQMVLSRKADLLAS